MTYYICKCGLTKKCYKTVKLQFQNCKQLKAGDNVEAFWSDWGQWCKAVVIGELMNGMCDVKKL